MLVRVGIRIRSDADPGLWWPGVKKRELQLKNFFLFILFFIKSCYLHILGPPWGMTKLWKRPSVLKRGHPTLQKHEQLQIIVYFCGSILPSWIRVRIRIPDTDPGPDPLSRLGPDPGWVRVPVPDSDSQHCRKQKKYNMRGLSLKLDVSH
jgi:hypothetical protein